MIIIKEIWLSKVEKLYDFYINLILMQGGISICLKIIRFLCLNDYLYKGVIRIWWEGYLKVT